MLAACFSRFSVYSFELVLYVQGFGHGDTWRSQYQSVSNVRKKNHASFASAVVVFNEGNHIMVSLCLYLYLFVLRGPFCTRTRTASCNLSDSTTAQALLQLVTDGVISNSAAGMHIH